MKQENNILINVIGTGYEICVGEVSAALNELFQRISKERKLSLHDFLFDDEFYKRNQVKKPISLQCNRSVTPASILCTCFLVLERDSCHSGFCYKWYL
ncbi:MAG: hypothetical protein IPG07_06225 [Crocinitomicaceae bacterium]|nr:hypothetical protein [Crocinitomicaceae bacterium]